MNVLILTPDRVGSTLLQRLLTIYMLRRGFDKPVINLHELTNGLVSYYHHGLNQTVLGKPEGPNWGYHQSLSKVIELLSLVDHYKTSRLAHYHIVNRKDSIQDQIPFYEYLNKNFFIIGCRRNNLLEHALSWAINAHSKVLNVYSPAEKVNVFADIYKNGITVEQETIVKYLTKYREYIQWSDNYFNVQSYFDYDRHMSTVEQYILNLGFMQGGESNSWQDMFGQSWDHYNTMHRVLPNLVLDNAEPGTETVNVFPNYLTHQVYQQLKGPDWPAISSGDVDIESLPANIQEEIANTHGFKKWQLSVNQNTASFLQANLPEYKETTSQINQLVKDGYLVTGIPLKLQSLSEKKKLIKNFKDCVTWYNQWVTETGTGTLYSEADLDLLIDKENQKLNVPLLSGCPGN